MLPSTQKIQLFPQPLAPPVHLPSSQLPSATRASSPLAIIPTSLSHTRHQSTCLQPNIGTSQPFTLLHPEGQVVRCLFPSPITTHSMLHLFLVTFLGQIGKQKFNSLHFQFNSLHFQFATFSIQFATFSIQFATFSIQFPTFSIQFPTFSIQFATFSIQFATFSI
jgi:hypothetical protein